MIRPLAVLLLLIVVTVIVIIMVKQAGPQPQLPLVNAAAECVVVNPCLYMSCQVRKGPFGGVDPDAGERDQRRIS